MTDTRREKDPLGPLDVPADALYGVQTLRAKQNFPISGFRPLDAVRRRAGVDQEGRGADAQGDGPPGRQARRRDRHAPPTKCSPASIATSSSSIRIRPAPARRTT